MKPKYFKQRRYTSVEKLGKDSVETQNGEKDMPFLHATSISSRAKHASDSEESEGFIGSVRNRSNKNNCTHRQSGRRQTEAFSPKVADNKVTKEDDNKVTKEDDNKVTKVADNKVTKVADNKVTKEVHRKGIGSSRTALDGESILKENVDGLEINNTTKEDRNKRKTAVQTEENYSEEREEFNRKGSSISEEIRKWTEMNEIPKTLLLVESLSLGQLTTDVYRILVRVKGENLTLKNVADVMKHYLHIRIDNASLENLLDVLKQREELFTIEFDVSEPLISPKTNIEVCSIFTSDTCKRHECSNLHICKYFLLSKCPFKKCKFGHYLRTSHNSSVLLNSGLDGLEQGCILTLIRNVGSRNSSTLPLLCKFYNNEGKCSKESQCRHLHVCKHYINEDCKFGKKCIRCHNLLAKQPISVLKRYGLTPNSYNYTKIMRLIKGTLQQGGVLLKREIQSINSFQKSQLTSDEDSESDVTSDSSQSEDDEAAEIDDTEIAVDNMRRSFSKNDRSERKDQGKGCLERKYSERDGSKREHPDREGLESDHPEREHTGREPSEKDAGHLEKEHLEREHPGRGRSEREHPGRGRLEREYPGRQHLEKDAEHLEREHLERKHPGRGRLERENLGRGRSEKEHAGAGRSEREHLEKVQFGRGRSEREFSERDHLEMEDQRRSRSHRENPGRDRQEKDRPEKDHPKGNYQRQLDNTCNSTNCKNNKPEVLVIPGEVTGSRTEISLADDDMISVKAARKIDEVKVEAAKNVTESQPECKYNESRRYNDSHKQLCTNKISDRPAIDAQEKTISIMSFQVHDKVFRARNMNGRWQLADLSNTWADMRENEAEEFLKIKDDFIRLAEKIVSKARNRTVGNAEA